MRDQTFHWQGYCSARSSYALASIVNRATNRAATVKIHRYDVYRWAHGQQSDTGVTNPFNISRIDSMNDDGLAVPISHLGGLVNLPSQVKCALFAGVTYSSTPITRTQPFVSTGSPSTTAVGGIVAGPSGAVNAAFVPCGFLVAQGQGYDPSLVCNFGGPNTQALKLNEGQGVAIHLVESSGIVQLVHQHQFFLQALVRDDTNNRTYSICCDLTSSGSAGLACFALFNGAGSGISLSLLSMHLWKTGYEVNRDCPGRVRFVKTRGNNRDDGEVVTPVAADPRVTPPAAVVLTRGHWGAGQIIAPRFDLSGGFESIFGVNEGGINGSLANTETTEIRRALSCFREVWPNAGGSYVSNAATGFRPWLARHHGRGEIRNSNAPPPIVLAPGEGFAVLMDTFRGDRFYAGFAEMYNNTITMGVELTFSYNSGVYERAEASA